MKIKIIRVPYGDCEVGEIIDLGEEQNRSLVEDFQRAVWVEEEEKKPRKKVVKTTTQVEDDESESEDSSPVRGADGRFVSKEEEVEKPKKRGFLSKLK